MFYYMMIVVIDRIRAGEHYYRDKIFPGFPLKGTRCLGSVELVFEKRSVTTILTPINGRP